ncbi:hypothetical protein IFM89_021767 [Coptis chinensis]|uniref:Uncharacterized protein n=1 Tax=Coptis chinensis TaxID=261450 RepID=A0A835ITS6_9MAGN|nr:hypothetical protein IFM89_021767 [Coptis chinensis]
MGYGGGQVQSVNEAGSGRGRRENSEGEVVEEHIVPRGTDGMKPMEVAALRGHEEDFKILFRVTSTIPTYPQWSPDGVMRHIDSSEARKQRGLIREENFKQAKTMAEDALCEKNYSTAISSYNKAIVLDPTNESILSNWSLCWALFKVNAKRALYFEWPAPYYIYSSTQVWHQLETVPPLFAEMEKSEVESLRLEVSDLRDLSSIEKVELDTQGNNLLLLSLDRHRL